MQDKGMDISNEDMYELSSELVEIIGLCKQLMKLHLFRYRLLVDNSPKGFDCSYALMTKRFFLEEIDKEVLCLEELISSLKELRGRIEEMKSCG